MPSWGEILGELQQSAEANNGHTDFDGVRRKYLAQLWQLTGRPVILYSTDWISGSGGFMSSITLEDMQGMMEVCRDLPGPDLDIVLHSPGGSAEATASIVSYLRQKYTNIRVFVPLAAMSAATMLALAADEIVMGKHSQLGPIDPQLVMPQGNVPARAIIQQFERAQQECSADPSKLAAWMPILQQYGPALIQQCEAAEALAKRLVTEWLGSYMLAGDSAKAIEVAEYFASFDEHQSHSLGIPRARAQEKGLNITYLEADQALQDAVLSVHHAALHTFAGSCVKLIENHLGRTYARLQQQMALPMQMPMQMLPANLTQGAPAGPVLKGG